jgi:hypothetical protein
MSLTPRPKGISMTEAVVFDVQGTLIDVSSIRHMVECDKPDFDGFHSVTGICPPHQDVVDEARRQHVAGKVIIVMTGMNEKFRGTVVTWLNRHNVPFSLLLMRGNRDFRKDFIVKAEMLKAARLRGFSVTHAWDDNPQIIDLWKNENIPVTVVPGWTGKT